MWPYAKRLKDQDPVEKYSRWLKRWLLGAAEQITPASGRTERGTVNSLCTIF